MRYLRMLESCRFISTLESSFLFAISFHAYATCNCIIRCNYCQTGRKHDDPLINVHRPRWRYWIRNCVGPNCDCLNATRHRQFVSQIRDSRRFRCIAILQLRISDPYWKVIVYCVCMKKERTASHFFYHVQWMELQLNEVSFKIVM